MATIKIDTERFRTTKQQKLIKMLEDKNVQKQANVILKNYINYFVPMETGALRRSAIVTHKSISWGRGLKYAHYQYKGEVYGPNVPIISGGTLAGFYKLGGRTYPRFDGGKIVGWFSYPGMTKHPTGRELGVPGEWKGWIFGYNTPGTKHHWDEQFNRDWRWKASAGREITKYLKDECKKKRT